jgi:hypothetical protein
MKIRIIILSIALLSSALLAGFKSSFANAAPSETVWMTVTAMGKHKSNPPAITPDEISVYRGHNRLPVVDVKPGGELGLAVLIDDGLSPSVGSQLKDLASFVRGLPANTAVAVAYGSDGQATIAQNFTTDHDQAAIALRLPRGTLGAISSPYLATQDLIKRWPASGGRRAILLISDGIDRFRGSFGPFSPDLDPTVEMAQKANITIYSIYAPGVGIANRRFFRLNNAQNSLSQLAEETGGEAFYLGFGNPVAFKPYLDEIQQMLGQQYLVALQAGAVGKKGRYEGIRANTNVGNVELLAPSEIFVPAN